MKNKIILLTILLLLTSCLSRIENKGYSFDLTEYKVKNGLSSKGEILKNMGSPTFISYIDDEIFWIYFEEKIKKILFFKPKILNRHILLIKFDNNNIVSRLNQYSLDSQKNIIFNKSRTILDSNNKSSLLEMFYNLGVNPISNTNSQL